VTPAKRHGLSPVALIDLLCTEFSLILQMEANMSESWSKTMESAVKREKEREKSEERKMKYINKIISLVSPILIGLTHSQIDSVLTKAKDQILISMIFTGDLYERENYLAVDQESDQKEDVTRQ
jgi:hypothetical protein